MARPAYFLVAVSNRHNLELCMRHGLAGFTNSRTGVWTFCEICEGDYVSFLYGARAHNLYQVVKREAINEAEELPPWPPLTFAESGRTYHFPFRVHLDAVRQFSEPLVRPEFAYVAENLLLRGGYRKTHFQADQTTLQNVSAMGQLWPGQLDHLRISAYSTFTPLFTRTRSEVNVPLVAPFREVILQSAIRQSLCDEHTLSCFLAITSTDCPPADTLEILGEKALPEGHIDLLIRDR